MAIMIPFNLRGMIINGYPCFVNVSKDASNNHMDCSATYLYDSPLSGLTRYDCNISSTKTKFSPVSFLHANHWDMSIYIINSEVEDILQKVNFSVYTVSAWTYVDPYYITPQDKWEHVLGITYHANARFVYNSRTRESAFLKTDSPQYQTDTGNPVDYRGAWHHIAVTSNGTNKYLFLDGKRYIASNNNTLFNSTRNITINMRDYCATHYADDIVLILGECRWTSDFTPPSTYLINDSTVMDVSELKARNILASDVAPSIILPDKENFKIY